MRLQSQSGIESGQNTDISEAMNDTALFAALFQHAGGMAPTGAQTESASTGGGVFANPVGSGGVFSNAGYASGQQDPVDPQAWSAANADTLANQPPEAPEQTDASNMDAAADQTSSMNDLLTALKDLMGMIVKLLDQMGGNGKGSGQDRPGSIVDDSGEIISEGDDGPIPTTPSGPTAKIPDPSEHVQTVQLGDKTMTIGGDGSASAGDVAQAASEMERIYNSSPTFKNIIDQSEGDNLTMTLGHRSDNTSWGGGGRVFLNLSSTDPAGDTFESLVGHEFAHASTGLGHGAEIESIEDKVAAEA